MYILKRFKNSCYKFYKLQPTKKGSFNIFRIKMSVLALFGAVKNLLGSKSKLADVSTSAFKVSRLVNRKIAPIRNNYKIRFIILHLPQVILNFSSFYYRYTGILLLIFSILTTSRQFFGEPIVVRTKKYHFMSIINRRITQ